jgi:hypothetical protein
VTRLYLHIGYPKTGTTAIQTFMAMNASRLAETGVLYPHTGRNYNAHLAINFALDIGVYEEPWKTSASKEELSAQLRDEVRASGCERVVMSSEHFILASSLGAVSDYFADFDLKIVVYLRRHDHLFESGFNQSLKTFANPPWEPTIESYIQHNTSIETVPYDYLRTLRRWADEFGRRAIIVRPYEEQQNVPDIFADFLGAIGVPDSPAFMRPGRVNVSLNPVAVAAIQAVLKSSLGEAPKEWIVQQLNDLGASTDAPLNYLSPALRSAVLQPYHQSYRQIAKEFMARSDGVLFREAMPVPGEPRVCGPGVGQADVLDAVLKACTRQMFPFSGCAS